MIAASSKRRLWRLGSVVLFCGVPILLGGFAVSNLVEASRANDEAARQQATLSHIVAQVARHRTRTLSPADTASLYLASNSGSLARAEIQERATKLVAQAGGTLVEAQIVGTPEQEADGTVAIQLTLTIDNGGLRDLLYGIETGLPLLDVTDLSVERGEGGEGSGGADGQVDESRPLHVDLTVTGRWRRVAG